MRGSVVSEIKEVQKLKRKVPFLSSAKSERLEIDITPEVLEKELANGSQSVVIP